MKNIIGTVGLNVEWIRVTDLKEGTFYATIRLTTEERDIDLDSRPSDAIALALRVEAPIFVCEQVLVEALRTDLGPLKSLEDLDDDFLANLPDEIFGKYKM
jgi:bifunctional DNase/RNase